MVFIQSIHNLSLIMRKTPDRCLLKDILEDTWQDLLKAVKLIKYKESLSCHNQAETLGAWWQVAMWYPGWGAETEKVQ